MSELIERQAAIDAVMEYGAIWMEYTDAMDNGEIAQIALNNAKSTMIRILKELPSAQPEIITCGECRHRDPEDKKCDCGHAIIWQLPRDDNWYCADAERRTDGQGTGD